MGSMFFPETSVMIYTTRCVATQENADLIYVAAED